MGHVYGDRQSLEGTIDDRPSTSGHDVRKWKMSNESPATVLLADDERDVLRLYGAWLSQEYDVLTASNGTEALELLDESVDVVLLDRMMPDLTGDEVLTEIGHRGLDCQVTMVTAVEPSFDLLDLEFDDYLIKPIYQKELLETVENMLALNQYDETVRTYFALVSKMATLQSTLPPHELESNEEYASLQSRVRTIKAEADREFDALTETEDFEVAFKRLSRHWDVISAATESSGDHPDSGGP